MRLLQRILLSKTVERLCEMHLQARSDLQRKQGWPSRFDSVSPEELASLDAAFNQLDEYRAKKRAELAAKLHTADFPEVVSAMVPLHDPRTHL